MNEKTVEELDKINAQINREIGYLSEDDEDDELISVETSQKFIETTKLEFKDLTKIKTAKIACVMMVKNEKKRIVVSLNSVVNTVCCYIIFDTGSEDETKEIIIEHCKKFKINLYMIEGNFVDFSTSRNCVLDYSDTISVDFLLLLDCNDELKGGDKLLQYANNELSTDRTAYLLCQQWWSGQFDHYWNSRFVKTRNKWRYVYPVHEVMDHPTESFPATKITEEVVLYQDRTQDDDKTKNRFKKDKILLRREYRKKPKDGRTVFYLAQTYSCLRDWPHTYRFYQERYHILDGFWEERYQAAQRCGVAGEHLGLKWEIIHEWYLKSYALCDRAEPLIYIAEHYNKEKIWSLAYMYAKQACEVNFPKHCSLFIDKKMYDYDRYSKLGIIAYYYNKFNEGKWACEKALEFKPDSEMDRNNLQFYLDKEKEIKEIQSKQLTKGNYFKFRTEKLRNENPNMRPRQIQQKIKLEWKTKNLRI
jgi:glycosyltransferase involved in cell wall biosynthesis